jgi:hypothetical protein
MKYLLAIIVLLSGCASFDTSIPITPKFPDVPKELLEKCSKLNLIDDETVTLSSVIKTTVKNYSLYHECAAKQELWTEWYNSQKGIYEDLKK